MKTFRYKFSKTIIFFIVSGIALSLFGAALNIYRLSAYKGATAFHYVSLSIMTVVSVALVVTLCSVAASSKYTVGEEGLIVSFGFVKSKRKIEEISRITLFKKTEKLVVYFSDEQYTVIVIKKQLYDDFTDTLLKFNRKIAYERREDASAE